MQLKVITQKGFILYDGIAQIDVDRGQHQMLLPDDVGGRRTDRVEVYPTNEYERFKHKEVKPENETERSLTLWEIKATRIYFECCGEPLCLATDGRVYVLNENGKTIETIPGVKYDLKDEFKIG